MARIAVQIRALLRQAAAACAISTHAKNSNLPLLRAVISSPLIMETTSIIGLSGVLSTFGCLLVGGWSEAVVAAAVL